MNEANYSIASSLDHDDRSDVEGELRKTQEAYDVANSKATTSTTTPSKKGKPTKKKSRKPKDMPRRPLSAYNIFFREQREQILKERKENGAADSGKDLFSSMAKTIGRRWKELKGEDAVKFQKLAEEDLKRYRREMEEYQLNMAKQHVRMTAAFKASNEVPALPPHDAVTADASASGGKEQQRQQCRPQHGMGMMTSQSAAASSASPFIMQQEQQQNSVAGLLNHHNQQQQYPNTVPSGYESLAVASLAHQQHQNAISSQPAPATALLFHPQIQMQQLQAMFPEEQSLRQMMWGATGDGQQSNLSSENNQAHDSKSSRLHQQQQQHHQNSLMGPGNIPWDNSQGTAPAPAALDGGPPSQGMDVSVLAQLLAIQQHRGAAQTGGESGGDSFGQAGHYSST